MSDDKKTVKAAIMLLRAGGTKPSIRVVDSILRIARGGRSIRKETLIILMREVTAELDGVVIPQGIGNPQGVPESSGNRNPLVREPLGGSGGFQEPQIKTKTERETYDTTDSPLPSVATNPPCREPSDETAAARAPETRRQRKPRPDYVPAPLPDGLPDLFPEDLDALKRLALPFLAEFGNVTTVEAKKRHGGQYVQALATMRSRNGVTVAMAWKAFGEARLAQAGRPLFGAQAKSAVSFLPPPGSKVVPFETRNAPPPPKYGSPPIEAIR